MVENPGTSSRFATRVLEQEHIAKTELASRMKTSRAPLDRMLHPPNPSLTVASLGKAADALGRNVELRFVIGHHSLKPPARLVKAARSVFFDFTGCKIW